MKTLQAIAIILLAFFGMLSCEIDNGNINPDKPSDKGTPTEIGKPLGATTSKTIGAQGGSISTADGKLTLTFPAGALSKETNITIRPVENKAWGGVGIGYEFGPDGSEFAKPVTFTYHYDNKEISGASLDNMALAFQDEAKVWQMTAPLTVNKTQKTLTGAIKHFSWWSMITHYRLTPEYDTVLVKQTKELQVEYLDTEWPWTDKPNSIDGLLVPLNSPVIADRTVISKIYLNGVDCTTDLPKDQTSGLLGFANKGNKAVIMYTAPHKKPNNAYNPVALSIELSHAGTAKLLLVSNLYVETDNKFSVGGSESNNIAINATYGAGALLLMFEDDHSNTLRLYTENFAPGQYAFNTTNTFASAYNPSQEKGRISQYTHCRTERTEKGTIIIDKIYQADGRTVVKGSVTGSVCTEHISDDKCGVISHKIMFISAKFTVPVMM
ncbi:hypothetical protein [Emticicia soli]|uniref:ZU5 domain-containing protein n=1 Tax=Emticicia soli TaxID=2027878 RepID=A0ABW5J342_9BACT